MLDWYVRGWNYKNIERWLIDDSLAWANILELTYSAIFVLVAQRLCHFLYLLSYSRW